MVFMFYVYLSDWEWVLMLGFFDYFEKLFEVDEFVCCVC